MYGSWRRDVIRSGLAGSSCRRARTWHFVAEGACHQSGIRRCVWQESERERNRQRSVVLLAYNFSHCVNGRRFWNTADQYLSVRCLGGRWMVNWSHDDEKRLSAAKFVDSSRLPARHPPVRITYWFDNLMTRIPCQHWLTDDAKRRPDIADRR